MKQQYGLNIETTGFETMEFRSSTEELDPIALIERLRGQQRVFPEQMVTLRKAILGGKLTDEYLQEALEHVVLYRLAQGGKVKKIRTQSIPSYIGVEPYRKELRDVVKRLIKNGTIVHRNSIDKRPKDTEPARASDEGDSSVHQKPILTDLQSTNEYKTKKEKHGKNRSRDRQCIHPK